MGSIVYAHARMSTVREAELVHAQELARSLLRQKWNKCGRKGRTRKIGGGESGLFWEEWNYDKKTVQLGGQADLGNILEVASNCRRTWKFWLMQ